MRKPLWVAMAAALAALAGSAPWGIRCLAARAAEAAESRAEAPDGGRSEAPGADTDK